MRFLIVLILSFFAMSFTASAQTTCPRCHGLGKVQTRWNVGVGGLSNEKMKCPNCGQMIFVKGDHFDICTNCNGTGHVAERTRRDEDLSDIPTLLSVEEYEMLQTLLKYRMQGVPVQQNCSSCRGTGICSAPNCRGDMTTSIGSYIFSDAPMPYVCVKCGGTGKCTDCAGTGIVTVYSHDPAEMAKLEQQIKYFFDLAAQRRRH